ncbi:MAG TPA: glucosamine-6-phosphate deaminase [Dongiaceae bacterium]|nr:glucosamine-6-phosphate deaminase [Dongiaceae bacterium]
MILKILENSTSLAHSAAQKAAASIQNAIAERRSCRLILATGNSQLEFLDALTHITGVDWRKVEAFHLDEYVGIPITHPASFRKYLLERFIQKTVVERYHFIEGDAHDLETAVRNIGAQLTSAPIDVAFVGIGENGHLAFNDPPADFETEEPYIIVNLDEPCRRQQVGEGWFTDISQVPTRAVSMSVRQILKAREIIAVVPEKRKAAAVKLCLEGEIRPSAPASILRQHPNTTIYLDQQSSSQLSERTRRSA